MTKKLFLVLALASLTLVSCGGGSKGGARKLRFAHNHTESNPSHIALLKFGEIVKEKTAGALTIEFFPNSILGDDRTVLEQVQAGTIDFTRVSANVLENFNKEFGAYLLPYLFKTEEHFYKTMSAPVTEKLYESVTNSGILPLTYQDAGERSFYMKSAPINTPADLKGKKVRVINSKSSIRMVELLGGVPTPIPYGEVYTAMQQGVIDGAENNAQALIIDKHGEVAKFYSLDAHVHLTDFVVISYKTWTSLTPEQQVIIKEAAKESTEYHNQLWAESIKKSLETAQTELGVKVNKVDKSQFEALVAPMYNEARQDPEVAKVVDEIISLR